MDHMTPRELDVFQLMAYGNSNQAIAADLVISPKSAEKLIGRVFEKCYIDGVGPHRRVKATLLYWKDHQPEFQDAIRDRRI
uniref:Putative LuxR-type DNA-binding HTH domain containing protein n=1 Tax=viral metagenome TaxID=1070528 RepID=A0A6M3JH83_9ZZZZ